MTELLVETDWGRIIALFILLALGVGIPFAVNSYSRPRVRRRAWEGVLRPEARPWYEPAEPFFRGKLERDERFARAVDSAVYRKAPDA